MNNRAELSPLYLTPTIDRHPFFDAVAKKASRPNERLHKKYVWHGMFAYSVGLGFPPTWADHRYLVIQRGSNRILVPGMVFHVNTSLRDAGVCGSSCSEKVVVTDRGPEILTSLPRQLRIR